MKPEVKSFKDIRYNLYQSIYIMLSDSVFESIASIYDLLLSMIILLRMMAPDPWFPLRGSALRGQDEPAL